MKIAVGSTKDDLNKRWTAGGYDHPSSQNHEYTDMEFCNTSNLYFGILDNSPKVLN
jgi:hypothetical protein